MKLHEPGSASEKNKCRRRSDLHGRGIWHNTLVRGRQEKDLKERKLSRHAKTMVPKMKTNPNKKQKRKRRNKKLRKLLKAAGMGKHAALYDVGILFQTGRKICGEPNLAAAAELMRDAAAAGDKRAEEWLRDYYFDDDAAVQAEA